MSPAEPDQAAPHTVASLTASLRALGLGEASGSGSTVIVHASFRRVGFVAGGVPALVEALLAVASTIVVPTHTPDNSDPALWANPPVPSSWWRTIRRDAPGFDPLRTPSRWMGVLAETVRTWPGAQRSDHPHVSFAALGPSASAIVDGHRLDDMLGEHSPLGALYRLDGKVLLLGVGHDSNTTLHLAETRVPNPPRVINGASVRRPDGTSRWVTWSDVVADADDFPALGAAFEATGAVTVGPVGSAPARLMRVRPLVDFGVDWIATARGRRS